MKLFGVRMAACMAAAGITVFGANIPVLAAGSNHGLPSAGIDFTLGNDTSSSLKDIQEERDVASPTPGRTDDKLGSYSPTPGVTATPRVTPSPSPEQSTSAADGAKTEKKIEETPEVTSDKPLKVMEKELAVKREETGFKSLVIADVDNYVNIRSTPGEDGEILGKLYDKSVGTFLSEQDGWYEITSGSVTGYVKAEYCVTGEAAVSLAKEVGTRIATVDTTTLKVREQPGMDSTVLGLIPLADQLLVTEELDGWVKVNIEEGDGYVSTDFVAMSTEFVKAESRQEEEKRLAKEAADRKAAQSAAAIARSSNQKPSANTSEPAIVYSSGGGSGLGSDVVNFASQFIGNPYRYGGTSLTNGADCSGFVMSVYQNFGVSLPHSSAADRSVGSAVDGLANAQPGDIICYSGHVGIYAGNGQIVHASTTKTGIIKSNASYRSILSIRRIF